MSILIQRFTYDSETVSILKDGELWLDGEIDTKCNHEEICSQLNLYETVNRTFAEFIKSKGYTVEDVDEFFDVEMLQKLNGGNQNDS